MTLWFVVWKGDSGGMSTDTYKDQKLADDRATYMATKEKLIATFSKTFEI